MAAKPPHLSHPDGLDGLDGLDAADLRIDAQRNRDRILEVARVMLAEHGTDVPIAAIARRAGVGTATLYRRFPTRDALVSEVFCEQFEACVAVIDDALIDVDPWRGFCSVVTKLSSMQAVDRGFASAFLSAHPDGAALDKARARGEKQFAELTRRAQDAGMLRQDFVPDDLTLVMMANGGIVADSTDEALMASRRLVGYLLQSFRAQPAYPVPPLPAPVALRLQHFRD